MNRLATAALLARLELRAPGARGAVRTWLSAAYPTPQQASDFE